MIKLKDIINEVSTSVEEDYRRATKFLAKRLATAGISAATSTADSDALSKEPPALVQQHQVDNQSSVLNQKSIDNSYILAATLYGEARGEGEKGMNAVLNVIMNRAKGNFDKAAEVVLKPKQFSMWNKISDKQGYANQLAKSHQEGKLKDGHMYDIAIRLVDEARTGKLKDITDGAQFYFNPKKVIPPWAEKMKKTGTIGHHDFYKL